MRENEITLDVFGHAIAMDYVKIFISFNFTEFFLRKPTHSQRFL